MQKYKRRHCYCESVQYMDTPETIEAIEKRLPDHADLFRSISGNLIITTDSRREILEPGDYFVFEASGHIESIPGSLFNIIYESV